MTDAISDRPIVTNGRILRLAIGIVALIELAFSAPGLPLLADPSPLTAQGITGWMIVAVILLTPLLALAALILAIIGHLRNAIFAIAAIVLISWINTAVSAVSYGLLPGDTMIDNITIMFQTFVAPIIATMAIILAVLKRNIALAAVMVSLPTLVNMLSIAAVVIGMASSGS